MRIVRRVAWALRVLLVLAFAALLMLETLSLPGGFRHDRDHGSGTDLQLWGFLIVAELVLICFQVIIVATWKLLSRVLNDDIFESASLRLIDVILAAMGVGWTLVAVTWCVAVLSADDPGGPLAVLVVLLAGAVIGLLIVIMRALLVQATMLRERLYSHPPLVD